MNGVMEYWEIHSSIIPVKPSQKHFLKIYSNFLSERFAKTNGA
jgi:hypothetical protein